MNNLPDDINDRINVAAYFITQKNLPYDTLCWMLAERRLAVENELKKPADNLIGQRAAEIYHSGCEYDILCWLIAELDIKIKHKSG